MYWANVFVYGINTQSAEPIIHVLLSPCINIPPSNCYQTAR